jgi:hypothetical protein
MKAATFIHLLPLCITPTTVFANECDAILEQGVRNTYSDITQAELKNNISTNFCSSSSSSTGDSDEKKGGVSVQIGNWGLGGEGSGSRDQFAQTKNELCTSSNSQLSDEGYHKVLTLLADKNIVDAWSKCNSNRGLIINGDVHDATQIDVSVKFLNVHKISQATITMPAQIIGMTCPNVLDTGRIIDGNELLFSCQRIGDQAITVNLNTDYMGQRLYIPKPQQIVHIAAPNKTDTLPIEQKPALNCTIRKQPDGSYIMPDRGCPNSPAVIVGTVPAK